MGATTLLIKENLEATEDVDAQVEKPDAEKPPFVMWQVGTIKDMNREFDVASWQSQDTSAQLNADWELVVYYLKRKGRTDKLRLQRSVESFRRKSG